MRTTTTAAGIAISTSEWVGAWVTIPGTTATGITPGMGSVPTTAGASGTIHGTTAGTVPGTVPGTMVDGMIPGTMVMAVFTAAIHTAFITAITAV